MLGGDGIADGVETDPGIVTGNPQAVEVANDLEPAVAQAFFDPFHRAGKIVDRHHLDGDRAGVADEFVEPTR